MNESQPVILRAEDVTRVVGRRHILNGVSFKAHDGELIALLGRNGAGKTTLLSLVAGRLNLDRGVVDLSVDGRPVKGRDFYSKVAFLPHDLFIYPDLTARENLEFFAVLQGVDRHRERAVDALDRVGLAKEADRVVREFSRGMQQRVAVGRMITSGAPVWFMDEPATGLDAPGRAWLRSSLRDHVEGGGLVVMASHSREEVATTATRVMVIESGRLVMDAPGGPDGAKAAFERIEECKS